MSAEDLEVYKPEWYEKTSVGPDFDCADDHCHFLGYLFQFDPEYDWVPIAVKKVGILGFGVVFRRVEINRFTFLSYKNWPPRIILISTQ